MLWLLTQKNLLIVIFNEVFAWWVHLGKLDDFAFEAPNPDDAFFGLLDSGGHVDLVRAVKQSLDPQFHNLTWRRKINRSL